MFRIKTILIISILGVTGSSFGQANLNDLTWLLGSWKRTAKSGLVLENWQRVSENTFEGIGLKVVAKDTTVLERLRLEQFGSEIFYVAKVAHNELPVAFKLVKHTEGEWIFENPTHDFPQRIIYKKESETKINVRVEKDADGKTEGFDVKFEKEEVVKKM